MTTIKILAPQKFTIDGLTQDKISDKQAADVERFIKDYFSAKKRMYNSDGYETDCTIHSAGKDGRCLICNELI